LNRYLSLLSAGSPRYFLRDSCGQFGEVGAADWGRATLAPLLVVLVAGRYANEVAALVWLAMNTPKAFLFYAHASDRKLLHQVIAGEGCAVEEAHLSDQSAAPSGKNCCLVVFDIDRPTPSLHDIAQAWHAAVPGAGLIVVSGRMTQPQRMALLEAGVSACLTRPLDVPELRARVRAASQRLQFQDNGLRCFAVGAATVDLDARVVRSAGGAIRLTPKECGIVERLAVHPSQTVPASELARAVWGTDPTKGAHSVRKFIQMLRRKLEPDPTQPQYLLTEARLGYRLRGT